MVINTWLTEDKSYTFNKYFFYDLDDNILVLSSCVIDLNTLSGSFELDLKYSEILSNLDSLDSKSRFYYYDLNRNIQWLGKIAYTALNGIQTTLTYLVISDMLNDDIIARSYLNVNNEYLFVSPEGNMLKYIKTDDLRYSVIKYNKSPVIRNQGLQYKDKLFLIQPYSQGVLLLDIDDNATDFYDGSQNIRQYWYVDDSIIILSSNQHIYCVDYNSKDIIYDIDLTDVYDDFNNIQNINNYYFNRIERTDTDLVLLYGAELPEVNENDNVTYQVTHLYKLTVSNYKTADAEATVEEYTIDYGNFNKYLNSKDCNIFTYSFSAFDHEYVIHVYGDTILTFVWDNEHTRYNLINISYAKTDRLDRNWMNPLELIELSYIDNVKSRVTFYTFNGTSWEVNNTIYSKSPIILRDDKIIYIEHDDKLIIDKYTTKPTASIMFDEPNYVFVNGKIIHTGITVNSYYYRPELTTRYALTIKTENAEFATNHEQYFEIEMQNGAYPLKLDITDDGKVEIQLHLIGSWILINGLTRTFTRKTNITFNHTLQQVWG